MFNNFVAGSSVRMVKQRKKKRRFLSDDSEEGTPKQELRESIVWKAARLVRTQLRYKRGGIATAQEEKEFKRRTSVLPASWNEITDQNDMV